MGLNSFLRAKEAAARSGASLSLGPVSPQVQRVIDLAGLSDVLGRSKPG
jgi:hypothetical protein